MKMSKNYENLDNTFNVESSIISTEKESADIEVSSSNFVDDIKKDYDYTRGNLYSLIEKGQEAINGILELAQESEMPRAYEVAGQLIKNVADATDKLMDLQKKVKEVTDDNAKGPTNVTNALFVGSTAELAKLLKQNENDKKWMRDLKFNENF